MGQEIHKVTKHLFPPHPFICTLLYQCQCIHHTAPQLAGTELDPHHQIQGMNNECADSQLASFHPSRSLSAHHAAGHQINKQACWSEIQSVSQSACQPMSLESSQPTTQAASHIAVSSLSLLLVHLTSSSLVCIVPYDTSPPPTSTTTTTENTTIQTAVLFTLLLLVFLI
ncbi:unnamed protein product [Pleuronectes platessa]|uniref:Uncharacterized protein n=1 Tax=Pleuronectes platessa TaxID=8262 RepID=A0A9N7ZEF7_PLEPL|nr:unnamed protein product [Pleuronectes platessa]